MSSDMDQALSLLQKGDIIGMPTETVYGLAGAIHLPQAIEKIFVTKARPFFDPLIVHVSSVEMARVLTLDWSPLAHALAESFWPGPLTMILPKSQQVNTMITSGLETVGIRMPKHPMALELITKLGVPLAAPSANKFGKTSPTTAEHVREEFKKEQIFVLDGGPCEIGLESTVLLIKRGAENYELSILRAGAVTTSDIDKALSGKPLQYKFVETVDKKESPGHMKHHYMPAIPLVISPENLSTEEIKKQLLSHLSEMPDEIEGVRIAKPDHIEVMKELVLSSEPSLAARELYARLRELGNSDAQALYFYKKPFHTGERWEALLDRISKAASLIL